MLPAHVVVGWRVLASPIALDERYRTGQVSELANGRVGRERYPTTCGAQNVTFSNRALVNPPLADPADNTVLRRTSKSRRLECSVRPLAGAAAPIKLRFMPLVRPTAQH